METTDKIRVVEQYVEAFANSDMGIIRHMFAGNARVEDPVGTPAHQGLEAVCAFYEGAMKMNVTLALTGTPRCAGNAVAFPFQVKMANTVIDVIDVFEFDDEGKVVSMKAYWGPENMTS
jgi:steroid delta-isomerase